MQGLYRNDERFGPGMLTYTTGEQDIGLWHREKLVRLCAEAEDAFHVEDVWEDMKDEIPEVYLTVPTPQNRMDIIQDILQPPNQFQYSKEAPKIPLEAIFNEGLHLKSLAIDVQTFDEQFFKEANAQIKEDSISKPNSAASSKSNVAKSDKGASAKSSRSRADSPSKPGSADNIAKRESAGLESRESSASKKSVRIDSSKSNAGSEKSQESTVNIPTFGADADGFQANGDTAELPAVGTERFQIRADSATSMKEKKTTKPGKKDSVPTPPPGAVKAWNVTPSSIMMQQHILRHQQSQAAASFDVDAVVQGRRIGGPPGPLEKAAHTFLQAAQENDMDTLHSLINAGSVDVDVTDLSGHTPLIAASVSTQ